MKTITHLFILAIIASFISCGVQEKLEKHAKAQADAEFIMNNLNKPETIDRFPIKYFPREQFRPFLDTLTTKCDFDSKQGKFVDYFSMSNNGKYQSAYIFEYFLNCDSLRFIYIYDFETKEPELFNFRIEGLEVENKMIINPEKQLLRSGNQ